MSGSVDPSQTARTESVRLAVYSHFARTGDAPTPQDLARALDATAGEARQALETLHARHDLVLDSHNRDRIVMAHPFASIPLGFSVMGTSTLWWGGCAWDSFAIPHLVATEQDVLVATRCPACDTPHAWVVGRAAPPEGEQVAHFLTPAHRIWDDVVHTCANQRLFCSIDCVDAWLHDTGHKRGYVMDLATLWRLARGWYAGRMERGYIRRDPVSAASYFTEVGLHGAFWGLSD
ncbi:membrane protein [Microtetraspora sp. NBRC 13810]|uniref:organomercurial lyase n=1 Tax=Microtetraspora sp. NBRC 13810 TaxID=3030990 RepID=UPI0024A0E425|nr:organomercurial lyase [Microtetraspora sp. NBRC 13810]GLW11547.1 membrane protein [Microtetraspora sp. NBRC 13810]